MTHYVMTVSADLVDRYDARDLLRELLGPGAKVWGRRDFAEGLVRR